MKLFRKQFKECMRNGTIVKLDTQKIEKIVPRPNVQGINFIEVRNINFCNKYMKRCSSGICKKERELL